MGLTSSLQIGRTGLLAGQTGIEVTGNNLSNISTRGYHRHDHEQEEHQQSKHVAMAAEFAPDSVGFAFKARFSIAPTIQAMTRVMDDVQRFLALACTRWRR